MVYIKKIIFYFISLTVLLLGKINSCLGLSILKSDKVDDLNPNAAGQTAVFSSSAGFMDTTIGIFMSYVIQGFLGGLGIIFIVLIILGGYNLMTAAGEEEKINKAKDTIVRAIIGLLIIIAAYSITYFVFSSLSDAGGSGGPQGSPNL